MVEQALPRGGQFDATPDAFEKTGAEGLLQSLDALAGGSQREMDLLGAASNAARIGHRDKQLQVNQIKSHTHLLFRLSAFGKAEG
jgi:hypothetical protein